MKYLKLEFKNAGLFNDNRFSKDKSFDNISGNIDRCNIQTFDEPITVHQISNMLHVLFGERPIPFNRTCLYSKCDDIFDIANNSYIKIDSHTKLNTKTNKNDFIKETIQLKKAVYNSYNAQQYITWETINKYLESDLFEEFLSILETEFNINKNTYTFDVSVNLIKKSNNISFLSFLEKIKKYNKTQLVDQILNGKSKICAYTKTLSTITTGLDKIIRLSGSIIVPISENYIEKLKKSKGCATLLDGGIVYIKYLKNDANINGYKKVSELSLSKN
jgi:hypothetical protein